MQAQQAGLQRGHGIRCFGEVRNGARPLEWCTPSTSLVDSAAPAAAEEHLTPVYPATEGVHQLTLRALTGQALQYLDPAGSTAG